MKFKFTIEGIDCPNCAGKLSDIIAKSNGIDSAKINFLAEKLTVESDLAEEAVMAIVQKEAKAFSKDIKVSK